MAFRKASGIFISRQVVILPWIVFFLFKAYTGNFPLFASQKPLSRILFGSCLSQDRTMRILNTIVSFEPELFIFLGDNIYADTENISIMKAKYKKLGSNEVFQKLLSSCPVIATWDDHDYGKNDAGADYPMKSASKNIFLDFWGEPPDTPRRKREGIYTAYLYGPPGKRVQIILLDTRFFREPLVRGKKSSAGLGPYVPNTDSGVSLLGEEQWRWLEEQLKIRAKLRVICSSIQVISEFSGWEAWANFPLEKKRLLHTLKRAKADGVFFISGDRHFAELSRLEQSDFYPLFDLTSSGLNRKYPEKYPTPNRFREGKTYLYKNFGMVRIDWNRNDPRLILSIHDAEGNTILEKHISIEMLKMTDSDLR
jgi:alkaline phosphatase D